MTNLMHDVKNEFATAELREGSVLHGFEVVEIQDVSEIKATAYKIVHQKTKAQLLWLKRDDDNKTFAICFKTIPSDDTGVFHILEHTVLNGSEKFPLKEPFVDLLKGSLQTFLNAFTSPDKTTYPISSRNPQDFINLMRVYLDAVFHPLCMTNENIFRQEGWHYELHDKADQPVYKGVVYNEMKGVFSSSESVAGYALQNKLFPDNCYGYCSGGDPDKIPDLTYEMYKANHDRFYNATNSRIFLDGDLDIDQVLGIINDEFLSDLEYVDISASEIAYQQPVVSDLTVKEFDATALEDKAILDLGYVIGRFDDYEKTMAFNVLSSVLAENNQSALKKAVLESGLAQDVAMGVNDSIQQPYLEIMAYNTNESSREKLEEIIRTTLEKVVKEGLDREQLKATINKMEFSAKERDYGYAPKGLIFGMQALGSWLYGGDPLDGIVADRLFASLKKKVDEGYFESLIDQEILHSNHHAAVLAVPRLGLEAAKQQKMAEKMAAYKNSLSDDQLDELVAFNRQFSSWQQSVDTPEAKATLPTLKLSDIDEKPTDISKKVVSIRNVNVIEYPNNTDGIYYTKLYFDIRDLTLEQMQQLTTITSMLGHLDTRNHTVSELNLLRKNYLGSLSFTIGMYNDRHSDYYDTQLSVSYSCLKEYGKQAWDIVREIMYDTLWTDEKEISNLLQQAKNDMEMDMVYSGHRYGLSRVLASTSELDTCKETISGYEYYKYLKAYGDKLSAGQVAQLEQLYQKVFTVDRLTLSLMGDDQEQRADALISGIHEGATRLYNATRPVMKRAKEGLEIASQVSYGEMAVPVSVNLKAISGKLAVIGKILSLDYLWNTVRAQGGAYGSGFAVRSHAFAFHSYRDPNPDNSLNIYLAVQDYLKQFISNDDDLDKYIIGTIGDLDPLLTNKTMMISGDGEYFSNVTYNDKADTRRQVLNMTKSEIASLLDLFAVDLKKVSICVVGSHEGISRCGNKIEKVEKV